MAAGLLFMPALYAGAPTHCFAIRNLRLLRENVHVEAVLQTFLNDIEVKLPDAASRRAPALPSMSRLNEPTSVAPS